MKKHSKSKSSTVPKIDPYIEGFLSKLLDRLVALERKMDTVISQTAGKTSGGDPPKKFQKVLYEAICADCHKVCEVPFRPSEDRPVYCKTCFAARKAGGKGKPFPVLTPVVLPPKTAGKLHAPAAPTPPAKKKKKKK